MKTWIAVALGLAGVGGLYLYERRSALGAVGSAGTPSTGAGGLVVNGATLPAATTSISDADILGNADLSADFFLGLGSYVPSSRSLSASALATWQAETKARLKLFDSQVRQPAARVPITSLTNAHYALAFALLSNKVTRGSCPLTAGMKRAYDDTKDLEIVSVVEQVIFAVANAVAFGLLSSVIMPIVDAADPTVKTEITNTGSLAPAIAKYQAAVLAGLNALGQSADDLFPITALPYPPGTDSPGAAFEQFRTSLSDANPEAQVNAPWEFQFEPANLDGVPVWALSGLFRPDVGGQGTWEYGWVSAELGCALPLAQRVPLIARVYRACTVLAAVMKPNRLVDATGASDFVSGDTAPSEVSYSIPKGLYAFSVGGLPLWGSVLPPHPADNARPLLQPNPAVVAAAIASTTFVQPKNLGTGAADTLATQMVNAGVSGVTAVQSALTTASAVVTGEPAPPTKKSLPYTLRLKA